MPKKKLDKSPLLHYNVHVYMKTCTSRKEKLMAVTMKEIAKKAGVTHATVSRVLNNVDIPVKVDTREKILRIAQKLHYQPNSYARSLKTGKTFNIGVTTFTNGKGLLARFKEPYLGLVYSGIGKAVGMQKYDMVFHDAADETGTTQLALKRMVDGLILNFYSEALSKFESFKQNHLDGLDIPYVIVHSLPDTFDCNSVRMDTEAGTRAAVEHLVHHKYPSIGYVHRGDSPPHHTALFNGYKKAMQKFSLPMNDNHIFRAEGVREASGYQLAARLLEDKKDLPRAFFSVDDGISIGMLSKFREAGVRVPEDVAIIGFSNENERLNNFAGLTSVKQPAEEKGKAAGTLLMDIIDNKIPADDHQKILIKPELVVRKTCGCRQTR